MTERATESHARPFGRLRVSHWLTGSGIACLLIGTLGIVGRLIGNRTLLTVHPAFPPFMFNGAVAVALSGVALLAERGKRRRLTLLASGLVALIGFAVLLETLLNADFGIDQRILRDTFSLLNPGRILPLMCAAFVTMGGVLFASNLLPVVIHRSLMVGIAGTILLTLGVISAVSVGGSETGAHFQPAYVPFWGMLSLFAMGGGLLAIVRMERKAAHAPKRWLIPAVAVIGTTTTLCLWQALYREEHRTAVELTRVRMEGLTREINHEVRSRILALTRLAERWERLKKNRADWDSEVRRVIEHHPGFQAIHWTDASRTIRWIVPLKGNEKAVGHRIGRTETGRRTAARALQSGHAEITGIISLVQGGAGFVAFHPVYVGGKFDGFLIGVFRGDKLLPAILASDAPLSNPLTITVGTDTFYAFQPAENVPFWRVESNLTLFGQVWRFEVGPNVEMLRRDITPIDEAVLGAGLLLTLLSSLVVGLAQTARLRTRVAEDAHRVLESEMARRKEMQIALAENEELFRAVFDNAPFAIAVIQPDGMLVRGNRRLLQFSPLTDEEHRLTPILRAVHPDDLDTVQEGFRMLLEGGRRVVQGEWRFFTRRGIAEWCHVGASTVRNADGTVRYVVAHFQLISERKRLEAERRAAEERIQTIFNDAPIGIALLSAAGEWLRVNRFLCEMFGYTEEELLSNAREVHRHHPDDSKEGVRLYRELVAGTRPRYSRRRRFFRKDGSIAWGRISVSGVYDDTGAFQYAITMVEDTSESEKAEIALQESEERFRAIFDHAPIGFAVYDPRANLLQMNQSLEKMLGYSREELHLSSFTPITHPEDREIGAEEWLALLRGELAGYSVQKRYVARDGRLVWANVNLAAIADPGGNLRYVVDMIEDITARRQTEERLSHVIRSANGILWQGTAMVLENGCGHWLVNVVDEEAAQRLFALDIPPGMTYNDAWYHSRLPQDRERMDARGTRALTNDETGYAQEYRCVDKHGNLRWFYEVVELKPLSENRWEITGVTTDITELKRSEEALRASEERFRQMFDASPLGIALIGLDLRFARVNPKLRSMLGYTEEELLRKTFIEVTYPDDIPPLMAWVERLLQAEVSQFRFEKRCIRWNGSHFWASVTVTLLRGDDGAPLGLFAMTEDITRRREAETQIQASLREKEVLLKEIHHRVKNNFQVMSSLLSLQAGYSDDPKTREAFQESQSRLRSMALVHEKLYQTGDLGRIPFAEYTENLVGFLFRAYGASGQIRSELNIEKIHLPVDAAINCGLILNELITNSLKYAFPEERQGKVFAGLSTDGSHYVLVVGDDGIGMEDELRNPNRNSLGLELVLTLVEQLRGTIRRLPQSGTVFDIRFPRTKP